MKTVKHYQELVERADQEVQFKGQPDELYEPVRYMMSLGGKRIRPVMALMANALFGGDEMQALRPAMAMEVFHNFTLIHDDIMDNAPVRRGKPTVHEQWNSSTAILSGDVMLVLAYDLLLDVPSYLLKDALTLFNETAKRVCEGQQMDMLFEKQEKVQLGEYVEMIGLKTAALLAGCLQMGALLAGADRENQQLIHTFGYAIGTAFQIQDDLLDSYGDEASFGKRIGGDIVANKKTYLTLKAFEQANAEQHNRLEELFSAVPSISEEQKISQVMALYKELDIRRFTEQARDSFYEQAMTALQGIAAPEEDKEALRALADTLINRNR